MLNPWVELLATRPQLLADHAQAWGGVLAAETTAAWAQARRRLWLHLAAFLAAAIAVVLAGVSVMLWALASAPQLQQAGATAALVGVPAVMLALAAACLWTARRGAAEAGPDRLARLAQQWHADLALLQPEAP